MLLRQMEGCHVFWILQDKITSWACLLGSGLKLIFHWNTNYLFYLNHYSNGRGINVLYCGKKGRISAKSLPVADRSSDRSLM